VGLREQGHSLVDDAQDTDATAWFAQGALLLHFLEAPLRLDSVTVSLPVAAAPTSAARSAGPASAAAAAPQADATSAAVPADGDSFAATGAAAGPAAAAAAALRRAAHGRLAGVVTRLPPPFGAAAAPCLAAHVMGLPLPTLGLTADAFRRVPSGKIRQGLHDSVRHTAVEQASNCAEERCQTAARLIMLKLAPNKSSGGIKSATAGALPCPTFQTIRTFLLQAHP